MNRNARLALFAAALLTAGAARADCKPLLDAMAKVAQQSRFAAYEVEGPEQAPTGEPDIVLVGKVSYVRSGDEWERIEVGDSVRDGAWYWSALRAEMAAGEVRCRAAGSGAYRGAPVAKIHYERMKAGKALASGTVWIDRRSGLPVYEGATDGSGGMAVVYGDAVKEPKVRR
ncbi:MAG: hypothetical protein AMXMBFR72_34360 [Betaproteobacteria bacterium]